MPCDSTPVSPRPSTFSRGQRPGGYRSGSPWGSVRSKRGRKVMNKKEYREYLESDHWVSLRGEKRRRVRKTAGKLRCAICASTDKIETHHLRYKSIYNVETSDLRLLCRECHQCAHDLLNAGLRLDYESHHAIFSVLKAKVKKARGFGNRNMFKGS